MYTVFKEVKQHCELDLDHSSDRNIQRKDRKAHFYLIISTYLRCTIFWQPLVKCWPPRSQRLDQLVKRNDYRIWTRKGALAPNFSALTTRGTISLQLRASTNLQQGLRTRQPRPTTLPTTWQVPFKHKHKLEGDCEYGRLQQRD